MQDLWSVHEPPPGLALDAGAVALLLGMSDQPSTAGAMLACVNRLVPVDYISIEAHGDGPPRQLEGRSTAPGCDQVPEKCFETYREAHYRCDEVTQLAHLIRGQGPDAPLLVLHRRAEDLPSVPWRQDVYDRQGLADRLSYVYAIAPEQVVSVHLYRSRGRGACTAGELRQLRGLGLLLRQAHRLAIRCPHDPAGRRPAQVARAERLLALRAPALSLREREVCARIACGLSADGIAVDLGVSAHAVTSVRKRAYAKLHAIGIYGGRMPLARWLWPAG
jgi:DNA-binding CsgD family transcriptional regulator